MRPDEYIVLKNATGLAGRPMPPVPYLIEVSALRPRAARGRVLPPRVRPLLPSPPAPTHAERLAESARLDAELRALRRRLLGRDHGLPPGWLPARST